ncbi:MAG TPA: sigma-70 family RNA polymerase sigma factor [bacterium]|nr:sigma-70 family RNA polymerase sigma factor [bacterium]HQL63534.1 sigma-70 family RNA polymerase sigma factor [bacterium]
MHATARETIVEMPLEMDSPEPDESLMLEYAKGDAEAFETLFQRHKNRVYGFIRRFMGGSYPADDLFQEVFLRIVRGRAQYRPSAKFTTWLFTIVRSVCIDTMRKQKHQPLNTPIEETPESDVTRESTSVIQITPRDHALERETGNILERLIENLPVEQREVLLLREKLNLPFREIARVTGCSVGTVKSRMRYALEALRKGLIAEGLMQ